MSLKDVMLNEIIQWIATGNNKALNVRPEKGTQDIAQPGLLPFPPLAAMWQRSETRALIQITDSRNRLGRHTHLSPAFARSLQRKALSRSPGLMSVPYRRQIATAPDLVPLGSEDHSALIL